MTPSTQARQRVVACAACLAPSAERYAFLASLIQYEGDSDYRSIGVFVWNFTTRFILLEIFILTLSRIRQEFSQHNHKVG